MYLLPQVADIKLTVAPHPCHEEVAVWAVVPDSLEQADTVVVLVEPVAAFPAEVEPVAAAVVAMVEVAVAFLVEVEAVALVEAEVVSLEEAVVTVEAAVVSLEEVEGVVAVAAAIQAEVSPICHDHYQRSRNGYTNPISTRTPNSRRPKTIRHG